MQIPLNSFEQHIDETILKRGLSYFENGQVNEPEEISTGSYEAIVEGSENYTVTLHIENGIITDYNCDCPYDLGPVCKHVAALIFYMQREVLELKEKSKKNNKAKQNPKAKPAKRKTVADKVNELLDLLSYDELKQFVTEKAAKDAPFRNLFLTSFAHLIEDESLDFYAKQVKAILRAASGRDKYIDYYTTRRVGKEVSALLTAAEQHVKNNNFRSAIYICCAVMEQMTDALQYADDSSGDIGGPVDFAYEMLAEMAADLAEQERNLLFSYCIHAYKQRIYSGWDWHLGMLTLASELTKSDEEAGAVIKLLDVADYDGYSKERAQSIKLEILRKTKGEKEAQQFLEENIANSGFRREAIARALKNKDYEKAKNICNDGIHNDKKDKPGLALEWYDWLLKIAQAQDDKDKIIYYARFLFIDNFRHEQDYYGILKNTVPTGLWTDFVNALINEIKSKHSWTDVGAIAGIYIKEQWWGQLMKLVAENASLQTLESYEKYLASDYAPQLSALYEDAVQDFLVSGTGRNIYKEACRYLRRMIKLGAKDKVFSITSELRKKYPQRRALLEELDKV